MKKYSSKLIIGSLIACLVVITSCSGDYLDTAPTGSIGTATVFETTENAATAVNGLAQVLTQQQYYYVDRNQIYCGENSIRVLFGEYAGQNFLYNQLAPGWASVMNGSYYNNTQNSLVNAYPWYLYYVLIGGANSIIANIDAAKGKEEDKKFLKAQALTFRAYGYDKLMQFFSYRWKDTNNGQTSGVVLRLDESTGSMPLATASACYEQIYNDCQTAIRLFEESGLDRPDEKVWLPNRNAAHAVYARVALNREDYPTALTQAKLARTGYPLMSNSDYLSGFCKPTSEWIMGSYGGADENQWYISYGTQFACNGYYAANTKYGTGAANVTLTDKIPTDDVRMKLFLTVDKFPGFDLTDQKVMDQTYAYFTSKDLKKEVANYIETMTPAGLDVAYKAGFYYLGGQLKFWVFDAPGVAYLSQIRSSEMVLIEAEANYFMKDESGAQNALIELNKTSGRNPNYTCTKTGDALFQEIVDYRGLELWGEGFNWYDYKRWGKDVVRKGIKDGGNAHAAVATTVPAYGEAQRKWTWGIPQLETDYNDQIK